MEAENSFSLFDKIALKHYPIATILRVINIFFLIISICLSIVQMSDLAFTIFTHVFTIMTLIYTAFVWRLSGSKDYCGVLHTGDSKVFYGWVVFFLVFFTFPGFYNSPENVTRENLTIDFFLDIRIVLIIAHMISIQVIKDKYLYAKYLYARVSDRDEPWKQLFFYMHSLYQAEDMPLLEYNKNVVYKKLISLFDRVDLVDVADNISNYMKYKALADIHYNSAFPFDACFIPDMNRFKENWDKAKESK